MKTIMLCGLACLALPLFAHALDAGPASLQQQETEAWLQLQGSNKAASAKPQTANATERELAMQRWLKSFQHDIPVFFEQDAGGVVDSGSGG
jgi:hypothetical protein